MWFISNIIKIAKFSKRFSNKNSLGFFERDFSAACHVLLLVFLSHQTGLNFQCLRCLCCPAQLFAQSEVWSLTPSKEKVIVWTCLHKWNQSRTCKRKCSVFVDRKIWPRICTECFYKSSCWPLVFVYLPSNLLSRKLQDQTSYPDNIQNWRLACS